MLVERNKYQRKRKVLFQINHQLIFLFYLGKKPDVKDKDKTERADDTGPAGTPNQQQLSSTTPTNFVRRIKPNIFLN